MKNLVINGDFRVDQRTEGGGASVLTPATVYSMDKWGGQGTAAAGIFAITRSNAVAPTPLFTYYARISVAGQDTTPAAGSVYRFRTAIEGFLCEGAAFGTANPQPLTLSFWARCSVASQNIPVSIRNNAQNRSYVTVAVLSAVANTWSKITITIPGDTAGTWLFNNGVGMTLVFDLGSGVSTATNFPNLWQAGNFTTCPIGSLRVMNTAGTALDIAGVQLEVGSIATSFDYQGMQTQLALCQRYYQKSFLQGTIPAQAVGIGNGEYTFTIPTTAAALIRFPMITFPIPLRQFPPTGATLYNPVNVNAQAYDNVAAADCSNTNADSTTANGLRISANGALTSALGNSISINWTADSDI